MDETAWEELDHPADIRLRIRGESLPKLLENAARGLIASFLDPASVDERERFRLTVDGEDPESLLVNWLEEVLFTFEVERFAPCDARIEAITESRVSGELLGEPFDPDRHATRSEIKAVTWHDLEIEETDQGFEVTIVFDV